MSWFSQGYEKVNERAQQIEEQMNRTFLPSLIIKDTDDDVYLSFLSSEPITYYEHFLPAKKRSYTCPNNGDASKPGCPFCASGNKATFRGAYLVVDHRDEKWKDKDGNEKRQQHTPKIAKFGIRVLKTLKKMDDKMKKGSAVQPPIPGGILDTPFSVMRSGSGTDTQYTFNPVNPNPEYFKKPDKPIDEKKTNHEVMIEAIKPLAVEQMLNILNGGSGQQQQSSNNYGTPADFGGTQTPPPIKPMDFGSDDDDVIDFN
jgi:hypothetical protein